MALRGDYLTISVQQHSSATNEAVIAETTSVTVDFSAESLETTSQTSGLNASFIAGKVTGTMSGDFLYTSTGTNWKKLFERMNEGDTLDFAIKRSTTTILSGECVLTSLSLSGGNSDQLVTGAWSANISGTLTEES